MRPRRAIVLGLSVIVLLAGALLVWSLRQPRITEENARKLKHGMTRAEVEAILCGPAGDYAGGHRVYIMNACEAYICDILWNPKYERNPPSPEQIEAVVARERIAVWWGRDHVIAVRFDRDDRVLALGHGFAWREPTFWESAWDSVRTWVGR